MPYRTFHDGRYVFIAWDRPAVGDIDGLVADLAKVRKLVAEPLVIFSVIPADGEPPAAAFRKQIVGRWEEILPKGETVHAVLVGSGIGASLNRAVLNTIRMFVRGRGIGKVYSAVATALREERVPDSITAERLRTAGILR